MIQKIDQVKQMQFEKIHLLDPQEYITPTMSEKSKISDIMEFQDPTEAPTDLDQFHSEAATRTSSKCLQDLLTESQSDTSSSDEDDFEVIFRQTPLHLTLL